MVPFGGWNMPVQYRGILDEARTVRTKAGLFDLGHMGRVRIKGPQAVEFLQKLQTNDAAAIPPGKIRYSMILNEQGLTQDDILVYRNPKSDGFFLVVNAGNTARDLEIMRKTSKGFDVVVEDCTHTLGMIAIQGPLSQQITQRFCAGDLASLKYYARTASPRSASARATRCATKRACRSTATRSTRRRTRSKPASTGPSR